MCTFFASVISSGTFSSFSSQPLSSFMFLSLPLVSSPGCISCLSQRVTVSTFPRSVMSSKIPLFHLNFTYSIVTFCFYGALSSSLANSFFGLSISVKWHVGLPLGDEEAKQLHALLSVCELNNRSAVTHSQQTLKEVM